MPPRVQLSDFERAIVQLLISAGSIEAQIFSEQAERIKKDFPGSHLSLEEIFSRINNNFIDIGFQVKTVALNGHHYYGYVNIEADMVKTLTYEYLLSIRQYCNRLYNCR